MAEAFRTRETGVEHRVEEVDVVASEVVALVEPVEARRGMLGQPGGRRDQRAAAFPGLTGGGCVGGWVGAGGVVRGGRRVEDDDIVFLVVLWVRLGGVWGSRAGSGGGMGRGRGGEFVLVGGRGSGMGGGGVRGDAGFCSGGAVEQWPEGSGGGGVNVCMRDSLGKFETFL